MDQLFSDACYEVATRILDYVLMKDDHRTVIHIYHFNDDMRTMVLRRLQIIDFQPFWCSMTANYCWYFHESGYGDLRFLKDFQDRLCWNCEDLNKFILSFPLRDIKQFARNINWKRGCKCSLSDDVLNYFSKEIFYQTNWSSILSSGFPVSENVVRQLMKRQPDALIKIVNFRNISMKFLEEYWFFFDKKNFSLHYPMSDTFLKTMWVHLDKNIIYKRLKRGEKGPLGDKILFVSVN